MSVTKKTKEGFCRGYCTICNSHYPKSNADDPNIQHKNKCSSCCSIRVQWICKPYQSALSFCRSALGFPSFKPWSYSMPVCSVIQRREFGNAGLWGIMPRLDGGSGLALCSVFCIHKQLTTVVTMHFKNIVCVTVSVDDRSLKTFIVID